VNYARQILVVVEYVPSLREKALGLIIEKCLEIDVEIKIEDTGKFCLERCLETTRKGPPPSPNI